MNEYEQYLQQRCHISTRMTERTSSKALYADYLKWVGNRFTPAARRSFTVEVRRALMRIAKRCPVHYNTLWVNGNRSQGFSHLVLRTDNNPDHRPFEYGFEIKKQPPRVQAYLRDRCEPGTPCDGLPNSLLTTLFYAWETRYPDYSTTVWFTPDVPWRPTVQKSYGVIPNALTASEIARILGIDRDVAQMAVRTKQFQGTYFPHYRRKGLRNLLAGRVPTWSLDLSLGRIDLTERLRAVDWLLQQDAANFKARYEIRKAVIGPRTEQADRLAGALSILPPSNNRAAELLKYLLDTASNSSLTSAALPTK